MAKQFRKPGPLSKKPAIPTPPAAPKPGTPPGEIPAGPMNGPNTNAAGTSSDQLIAQVQDKVRGSIPANLRVPVQKIVMAGSKIMYSPQTHHLMVQAIQSDNDPAHAVGMGVAQLMTLMWQQSKGTLPIPAIVPAGVLLVCEALDFMEQAKLVKPDNDLISNAVQTVVSYLMQKMGITPQQMGKMANAPGAGQDMSTQTPGGTPDPTAAPAAPSPAGQPGLIQQNMGAQ